MSAFSKARVLIFYFGYTCLLSAQFTAIDQPKGSTTLRGSVADPGGQAAVVELIDFQRHLPIDRVAIHPDGRFVFYWVPDTTLEVRIVDQRGAILKREWITGSQYGFPLQIQVDSKPIERASSESVTAYQLAHKVPGKARNELRKAQESTLKKDNEAATQHLLKAIQLDPGFLEAYNNLGTTLAQQGKLDQAMEAFQKAAALDPRNAKVRKNVETMTKALIKYRRK